MTGSGIRDCIHFAVHRGLKEAYAILDLEGSITASAEFERGTWPYDRVHRNMAYSGRSELYLAASGAAGTGKPEGDKGDDVTMALKIGCDTGSIDHLTDNKAMFKEGTFQAFGDDDPPVIIKSAGNNRVRATGKGDAELLLQSGYTITSVVMFVPNAGVTVMSVRCAAANTGALCSRVMTCT